MLLISMPVDLRTKTPRLQSSSLVPRAPMKLLELTQHLRNQNLSLLGFGGHISEALTQESDS